MAAIRIEIIMNDVSFIWVTIRKFHVPNDIIQPIEIRMATSPIRFLSAVIIPALKDRVFW